MIVRVVIYSKRFKLSTDPAGCDFWHQLGPISVPIPIQFDVEHPQYIGSFTVTRETCQRVQGVRPGQKSASNCLPGVRPVRKAPSGLSSQCTVADQS